MLFITASLLILSALPATAKSHRAEVRDLRTQDLLFNKQTEVKREEDLTLIFTTYVNPDGTTAIKEATTLKDSELIRYEIQQEQLGLKSTIEVQEAGVKFSGVNSKGEAKSKEAKNPGNLVVGPSLPGMILKHWDKIEAGERVQIHFAAWDRGESIGFRLFKSDKAEDPTTLQVIMQPSSWLIRRLVNDLVFTYDTESRSLRSIRGRATPKQNHANTWRDLDALIVYE